MCLLIAAGADATSRDNAGHAPLHLAAYAGDAAMCHCILQSLDLELVNPASSVLLLLMPQPLLLPRCFYTISTVNPSMIGSTGSTYATDSSTVPLTLFCHVLIALL